MKGFFQAIHVVLLGLLGLNVLLAACASTGLAPAPGGTPQAEPMGTATSAVAPAPTVAPVPSATPEAITSHGNPVGGYVELVDALRGLGAVVEPAGSVTQDFFSVEGQVITVDGMDVQVFEYADQAARQAESSLISPDGQPSPTMMITWVAPPNFWAKGRLIVLYLGEDKTLLGRLSQVLGTPLTETGEAASSSDHPAAQAAIAALARQLNVAESGVTLVSFEAVEWPDACLGIQRQDVMCAQVITPGYRVVLGAGGQEYQVHTNLDGTSVVFP